VVKNWYMSITNNRSDIVSSFQHPTHICDDPVSVGYGRECGRRRVEIKPRN
jgi:hypothetical protein